MCAAELGGAYDSCFMFQMDHPVEPRPNYSYDAVKPVPTNIAYVDV